MYFELWNGESGNAIGDFDTEADALRMVREMVEDHGRRAAAGWGLLSTDDENHTTLIAADEALIDRALVASTT